MYAESHRKAGNILMKSDNMIILFQGDSITDCGRDREQFKNLGNGYPFFLSGEISYKYPDKSYTFLNRGISGNRIVDLYARIKEDIINLRPDVLSILIGVNDVWHEFASLQGVGREKFNKIYRMLLDEIKEANPDMAIVILEPFILKAGEVTYNWENWHSEMRVRREIVKSIAEDYKTIFIPLQEEFDRLCEKNTPGYWAVDGVHPTGAGHMAIAHMWSKYVLEKIGIEQ